MLSTYFCFKTRRTKNIILYKTFSINIESIIISVHCSYMCVYICQHPSNQYWSNIYWDGSFKQDLTFLKNRFLLQVLKQIFVKDSLLRDLSWTTVVCFLKFCKLESKRKANFKCVKNIWISIYICKEICNFDCEKSLFIWNHIKCVWSIKWPEKGVILNKSERIF